MAQEAAERAHISIKQFYLTSIWDESMYQAWSAIVQQLVPHRSFILESLKAFCEASGCHEAILFEKSSFLVMGSYCTETKDNLLRYEKVSNIVKQFRLTCRYAWFDSVKSVPILTEWRSGMKIGLQSSKTTRGDAA